MCQNIEKVTFVKVTKLLDSSRQRELVGKNDYKDVRDYKYKKDLEREIENKADVLLGVLGAISPSKRVLPAGKGRRSVIPKSVIAAILEQNKQGLSAREIARRGGKWDFDTLGYYDPPNVSIVHCPKSYKKFV